MKTSTRLLKVVALFFSVLILFQGCTVYKSTNVTLEEAVKADTKVRLKTKDHQTLKFKKIGIEDGKFYGLLYYKNTSWVKTKINEDATKAKYTHLVNLQSTLHKEKSKM